MHDDDGRRREREWREEKKKKGKEVYGEWREMVARREWRFMNSRSDVTLTHVALTPLTTMCLLSIDYNLLTRIDTKL